MKTSILVLLTSLLFLANGCGVKESDYNQVVSDRDALKEQVAKLQKDNESLKEKALSFEKENKTLADRVEKMKSEAQQEQRAPQPKPGPKKEGAETKGRYYEVKKGDNLWGISRRTGVPAETLRELNKLQDSKLQVGQKLLLAP